jgi:hypothetical protein
MLILYFALFLALAAALTLWRVTNFRRLAPVPVRRRLDTNRS